MSGKATGLGKAKKKIVTNKFGPLNCDHGKGSTPLGVKEDVAHGRCNCDEERVNGRMRGSQISTRSNHHGALGQKRTEPHEGRGF